MHPAFVALVLLNVVGGVLFCVWMVVDDVRAARRRGRS